MAPAMRAPAMKGLGPGLVAMLVLCVVMLLALATSIAHAAGESGVQVQQQLTTTTTQRSTANTMAFEKQSLFQCPCSYQYCDKKWKYCSCNVKACSCSCHNSAHTTIPDGATVQVLPST